MFIHSRSSLENSTREQSVFTFSHQNGVKTLSDGAAMQIWLIYNIRKYPPSPPPRLVIKARQACLGKNKICAGKEEHV